MFIDALKPKLKSAAADENFEECVRIKGKLKRLEALKDKYYIKSSIEYINKNRIFLISNLEKIGLKCTNSITTNFLADISNISKDSTELVEKLKERGILITDAKAFRVPRNIYIRISVATEEENFQFINVLSELKNNIL